MIGLGPPFETAQPYIEGKAPMTTDLTHLAAEDYCYLTTTGRVSGQPHTIEIWFALDGPVLYMLSGGGAGADWVKNLLRAPEVTVRIADVTLAGRARVVEAAEEDALSRRIVVAKYQPRYSGDLADWGRTSLPVAVDLTT
jgi:deazaflavin-dependent oxidoreductase (nitroreductase family)